MTAPARTRSLLAIVAVCSLALAGCGGDDTSAADPTSAAPSTGSSAPQPSDPASDQPSDEPASSATAPSEGGSSGAGQETVPVYFVGDSPQGPRLLREFRRVDGADPLAAAAALATSGDALDPDYRSSFPAGSLAGVTHDEAGGRFVAELTDDAWEARGDLSAAEARLAVQQLVYTLQGVAQVRDPLVAELDGQPVPLLGVDTAAGVAQAPQLDVLALVNVSEPEQGATVGDTFTASGVASSFEATVPWEVRGPGGAVVQRGFATADGWMDRLYPWTTEVDVSDLAPGQYTFVALTDDPSGGEGPGPSEDTKTITVE